MALSLGRAGLRTLLTGSHAAKGIAGRQIPIAGFKSLLPGSSSPLRPQYTALHSQFRVAHSLVVVVVPDGPIDVDSVAMAVKKELADLDVKLRAGIFDPKEEATDLNKDADSKDISGESPEKLRSIVTVVADGKLSEVNVTDRENTKTASVGPQVDGCLAAIERLRKDLDMSLYAVRWQQETLFEKLEARIIGQGILLKGLRDDRPPSNFMESLLVAAGRRLFPKEVIMAKRTVMIVVPYVAEYAFYGTFIYSLYKINVPICVKDYVMLLGGSYWLASTELSDKLQSYYDFYKNGGVKKDKEPPKKVE